MVVGFWVGCVGGWVVGCYVVCGVVFIVGCVFFLVLYVFSEICCVLCLLSYYRLVVSGFGSVSISSMISVVDGEFDIV